MAFDTEAYVMSYLLNHAVPVEACMRLTGSWIKGRVAGMSGVLPASTVFTDPHMINSFPGITISKRTTDTLSLMQKPSL